MSYTYISPDQLKNTAVLLPTIPEMHKKRFICPYILYCLNTLCMKPILRIHLSDSLKNASCPACNEDKSRVNSCLWFLLSGEHGSSLLMLVQSLMDRWLPHKEELAACPEAAGRESCNSSPGEMIPLGEVWGPWAQCKGEILLCCRG